MSSAASIARRLAASCRPNLRRLYSTPPPSLASSPRSASRRAFVALGATALAGGSYLLGSFYPPELATYISPRSAPPPLDPHAPGALAHSAKLEIALHRLPPLLSLRERPDANEWYETRPYVNIPEERRVNALTAGALRGPGKLAIPPLVRARNDESEAWVFLHLGRGLCGHDGIVHGGLLATIMDEALGRIVSNATRTHSSVYMLRLIPTIVYREPA
jgi:hypothetical protein